MHLLEKSQLSEKSWEKEQTKVFLHSDNPW